MKDARPRLVLEDNDEDFETLVRLTGSVPIWLLLSFRPHNQIQPGSYIIQ